MSSLPTLGYWDCRGRAEPIRFLLNYVGVQFNDKRYPFGAGTTWADIGKIGEAWMKEKFTLGLDFPNVPYYIEGDLKLTQSLTILRYLARKHGLMAKDERTLARQELIEQQLTDINQAFIQMMYDKDYQKKRPDYIKDTLSPQMEAIAKFLGSNDWLTTDFSYVDIMGYEMIDKSRQFSPQTIEKFPTLGQYLTRFENLKPMKEYLSSPKYKNWPFGAPMALWGYNK